ncbi:cell death protein 6-like isoform X3 [Anneissia japonica]|uniref:cell death protein 6-like isoform X3 n=1 Tax=Anneissia japonica TaxID=1529436 RepID=UPI0014255D92|nr:cell death protein 6-like isoform X3 [Anneissia japonica]
MERFTNEDDNPSSTSESSSSTSSIMKVFDSKLKRNEKKKDKEKKDKEKKEKELQKKNESLEKVEEKGEESDDKVKYVMTDGNEPRERGSKTWPHAPDTLTKGHVVYNVKFLGSTEVERAKGADLVKESVKKLKFNRHVKRSEGLKPRKVELTISADGVALQDRATREKLYTYPLHRISYCADDKSDKRICAFIAKEPGSDKHICFVLDSEKCAEEITLTVGQAFDLAYKKFLDTSSKESDLRKQITSLQRKVQSLEVENAKLKMRITELEGLPGLPPSYHESNAQVSEPAQTGNLFDVDPFSSSAPSAPPTAYPTEPINGASVGNGQASNVFETDAGIRNGHSVSNSSNGIPVLPAPPQIVKARTGPHVHDPSSPTSIPPPLSSSRRPRPQGRPQAGLGLVPPPGKPSSASSGQAQAQSSFINFSAVGGAGDPFGQAPFGQTVVTNPFEVTQPSIEFDSPADRQMREMQLNQSDLLGPIDLPD